MGLLLIQKYMFHENYCFWGAGASQAFDLLHDRNSPAKAGLFRACRVNTLKTQSLYFVNKNAFRASKNGDVQQKISSQDKKMARKATFYL